MRARAKSHEGKMQVELARLQYLATRLVRRWSHLERQSGGIGMRGGPGEAQIELDRRMIDDRIKAIKEKLKKVQAPAQHSAARPVRATASSACRWSATPMLGKSTLFNALVKARTYAADQLCSPPWTQPRARSIWSKPADQFGVSCPTPSGSSAICRTSWSRPSEATLQEAADADLLLHVVDASLACGWKSRCSKSSACWKKSVPHIPQILVYNKQRHA